MSLTVRRAKPSDVRSLLPQLQRFSQFFGGKHALFPDCTTAGTPGTWKAMAVVAA